MAFEEGIEQLENYVKVTKLNILVWGPGEGGGEHYEKRKKIRQVMQENFPKADVRFSEEESLKKIVPGAEDLSTPDQELWHLGACDVCVVLDTSKGAGEEIAHFTNSTEAYKLLIFTHERYRGSTGFPAALRKYNNQIFYSEEEYKS